MRALWTSDSRGIARYDSLQPHYNLLRREDFESGLDDVCRTYGLGVIPYSPLAGGFLTGKYRKDEPLPESARAEGTKNRYFNERGWNILEAVSGAANNRGNSVSQIALAWQLSKPVITSPIIGPRSLEQLTDNLGAVGLRLTEDEMEELDQASALA
jgi:aryl-alcohol dehydrogenase-like predicted oxidoreductase